MHGTHERQRQSPGVGWLALVRCRLFCVASQIVELRRRDQAEMLCIILEAGITSDNGRPGGWFRSRKSWQRGRCSSPRSRSTLHAPVTQLDVVEMCEQLSSGAAGHLVRPAALLRQDYGTCPARAIFQSAGLLAITRARGSATMHATRGAP